MENENQYYESEYGIPSNSEYIEMYEENLMHTLAEDVVKKTFLFMFAALVITTIGALSTSPMAVIRLFNGRGYYLLLIAEIAIVFIGNFAIQKNNAVLAGVLYAVYSYLTGYTFSIFFMAYDAGSIAVTFGVCAGMFLVMTIFGLTTRMNLMSVGSYCVMGLVGLLLAGVANMLIFHSLGFEFITSVIGIGIFLGLTAYDVQKIKERVEYSTDDNVLTLALYGGFELYLDFINIFIRLLGIFGKKRR